MKNLLQTLLFLGTSCVGVLGAPKTEVYFSPGGGCQAAILREINSAKKSIHVQAYSFSSAPIARALVDAHQRGVKVYVILDSGANAPSRKYSAPGLFRSTGIRVLIDAAHSVAHNKVCVIDRHTVITGSYNFTAAAEKQNAENLLILHSPSLAKKYLANWREHARHTQSPESNETL